MPVGCQTCRLACIVSLAGAVVDLPAEGIPDDRIDKFPNNP
jgi:hypothetical protein